MDNRSPSMLKSALIGGSAFGFVAGLPIVGALNCACCALVIAGGFLASYLYSKECSQAGGIFGAGTGAMVGLIAGLFYAVATSITQSIVQMITGASIDQVLEQVEGMGAELPPEAEPLIEFLSTSGPVLLFFIGLGISLVVGVIFSTIGGLIGGSVFKVAPAPPADGS